MNEETLFHDARQMPQAARTAFLARACGENVALRERVEDLLQVDDNPDSLLEPKSWPTSLISTLSEAPGQVIGPYKLLEQIGEGGFGVVFLAEQTTPIRRRVALKIVKPGMDTRQVLARFEAERQALALMDHPSIAKVFDAGVTEQGRSYFVMELVQGVPINEYCDECQLPTRERLELFIAVCQAVQHAHQKGIIHRDLKPTNVLVAMQDGRPVPKIIDFGIAKAIEQRLTEHTLTTGFAQMIGTPMYMSPEQAELSPLGVDTRTDIYSLGVLLYELLSGTTPFDRAQLHAASYDEMRRIIREVDPPLPSTRLTTLAADLATTVAGHRRTEPRRLRQAIDGDLDWIVMKCLEKDRNRRYETPSSLARDIERSLRDEAVQACPPSATNRFRKFARRNMATVVMAIVIGSAILLAIAGLSLSTILIAREKRATESALHTETLTRADLQQALARERRDSYFHRITLAQRELSADNLGRALQLLGECPEDLRQWEWHYLMRLCRVEPVVLRDEVEVHSVAIHRRGEQLAAACGDGTVKIMDARTGKLLQTLVGHKAYVFSVAYSPNGQHLATASADRTIRLWDVATGRQVLERPGHGGDYAGMAYAVAFSPDGRQIVSGGEDGIATIWGTTDGREVHRLLDKHEGTAVCVAFSPDGQSLATGSWGGVLRIWNARSGQLLHKIPAHTHRMCAVVFSPNGKRLATAGFDRTIKVWEATTGKLLQTLRGHTGVITGLAFSGDGQRLFSSGGEDKTVKIWDPQTEREILNLRGHTLFCHSLASSPDSLLLASASKDGTIRLWDATPLGKDEGLESITREHDYEVWSVEFSSDGSFLASAGSYPTSPGMGNLNVQIWDGRNSAALRTLNLPPGVWNNFHVAFSPDGQRLAAAAATRDGEAIVSVWETETGREALDAIRERTGIYLFVTFDPTGRYLVREGPEHTVQVRDAETGKVQGIVGRHTMQIWGMAFSPDGHRLATASNDGTVRVWAWDPTRLASEQQPELTLDVRVDGYGDRVAFSSDGRHLATGGDGYAVDIWNAQSGELRRSLSGHTGDVVAVAFSPDGRWLATAGEDTTVRIWDTRSWKLQHTLRGHTGLVMSLAFSPDSLRLASGSRDHTMKVWDTTRWENEPDR